MTVTSHVEGDCTHSLQSALLSKGYLPASGNPSFFWVAVLGLMTTS